MIHKAIKKNVEKTGLVKSPVVSLHVMMIEGKIILTAFSGLEHQMQAWILP